MRSQAISQNSTKGLIRILSVTAALLGSLNVVALPQGGVVTGGNSVATINSSGNQMTVNQSASRAVYNFTSYDMINPAETVTYNMPSGGAALNIINQGSASQINGTITSTGAVYLINPHGILFGSSANIQVGSLVASSLSVDENEFLSGGALNFIATTGGDIINHGIIKAATGSVALLGRTVVNTNQIQARLGSITLASGTQMTLDFDGNNLIQVAVNDTVKQAGGVADAIANSGLIEAQNVTLEARAAANIFTNAVNHTGMIRAKSFSVSGSGNVSLVGEGAPVTIDPGAVLFVENQLTVQETPGVAPPPPPPAPPAPPAGTPSNNGSDDNLSLNNTLASTVNPVEGSESASVTTAVVGLYSVEGEGVRLPADQLEEPL